MQEGWIVNLNVPGSDLKRAVGSRKPGSIPPPTSCQPLQGFLTTHSLPGTLRAAIEIVVCQRTAYRAAGMIHTLRMVTSLGK